MEIKEIETRVRWFARVFGQEGLILFLTVLLKSYCEHNLKELFNDIYYEVANKNKKVQ